MIELLEGAVVSVRRHFRNFVKNSFNISILSEFDDNITPKYNHDRCERSVQMRLYTLNKPQFAVVIALFFLCYAIALFIGLVGPPITSTRHRNARMLPGGNDTDLSKGPFHLKSPLVSPYCYQLWLFAQFHTAIKNNDAKYQWKLNVRTDIRGIVDEKTRAALADVNLTTLLKCQGSTCDEVILSHLWFLSYPTYMFNVSFKNLNTFNAKFPITDITFYWRSYNPSFTQLQIWFRFLFMILAFGVSCWYFQSLRSYSMHHWAMEQKWMGFLLPLLLLYNNPIFPLVFMVNNWFPSVMDAVFQVTFMCGLLLFWLCVYHGIRQNTRKFAYFYAPKLVLVGLIWFCGMVLAGWDRYHQAAASDSLLNAYSYQFNSAPNPNFEGFKIAFYVFGSLYVLYLGFLLIRAYSELKNLPYFDVRLKFFTFLMVLVIVVTVITTTLKFGVAPTLQDNFVAHLDAEYSSSVEFMAFYGLLNLYLCTMAYVYSPNPELVTEFQFKDAPGLNLLNDSEDDIGLYGNEFSDKKSNKLIDDSDDDSE